MKRELSRRNLLNAGTLISVSVCRRQALIC
jgi:hypothetical protein